MIPVLVININNTYG